jgi:hypothetical protein
MLRPTLRTLGLGVGIGVLSLAGFMGTAGATPTGTPGQPSQTCGSSTAMNRPGNASNAAGSAFNPNGTAGTVYAGQQPQNSGNSHSVSQYDVACFQNSSNPGHS